MCRAIFNDDKICHLCRNLEMILLILHHNQKMEGISKNTWIDQQNDDIPNFLAFTLVENGSRCIYSFCLVRPKAGKIPSNENPSTDPIHTVCLSDAFLLQTRVLHTYWSGSKTLFSKSSLGRWIIDIVCKIGQELLKLYISSSIRLFVTLAGKSSAGFMGILPYSFH